MAARCIQLLCITCHVCLIVQVCSLQGVAGEVPDDAVYTDLHRHVRIGESVALKCQFRGIPLAVYWKKGGDPIRASTLVSWIKGDPVTGSCGGERLCQNMEMNENRSLVIKKVSIAEQGRYICRVANYKGKMIHNFTEISVFSPPRKPYPFINECLRSLDMNSGKSCVISTAEDPINISCTASGYFPDLDLFFLSGSQSITIIHSEETTNGYEKKIKSITIQASPRPEPYVCVASDIPGVVGLSVASLYVTIATDSVDRDYSTKVVTMVVPITTVIIFLIVAVILRVIILRRNQQQEPVSYVELWKLVDEGDIDNVNKIVSELVGNLERNMAKDDLYTTLCEWKKGSSVNVRSLYRAIKKLGFHDDLKAITDFRACTCSRVSDDKLAHICSNVRSCEEETVKPILRALYSPDREGSRPIFSTCNSFEDDLRIMKRWKSISASERVTIDSRSEAGYMQVLMCNEMTPMDPSSGEVHLKVITSPPNQMIRLCLALEEAGKKVNERHRPVYLQLAKTFFKISALELPENAVAARNEDDISATISRMWDQSISNYEIRHRRQQTAERDNHRDKAEDQQFLQESVSYGSSPNHYGPCGGQTCTTNTKSTSELIQIMVKDTNGKTHIVRVSPTDKVENLKFKIQQKLNIAPSQQWLQFQSKILSEMSICSLKCHGLQDMSTVQVHGRLRGGALLWPIF